MSSTTRAVRALTAWQFRRIFRVIVGVVAGALLLLWTAVCLAAWYWSAWWLIFLLILLPLTVFVLVVGLGGWWLSGKVLPRHLSREEKQQIDKFNDKLFGLVEAARTPLPVLGILFAFDVLRGRGSQRIRDAIDGSDNLRRDFGALKQLFADTSDIDTR